MFRKPTAHANPAIYNEQAVKAGASYVPDSGVMMGAGGMHSNLLSKGMVRRTTTAEY